jgi:hypothetical protein
MVFMRPFYLIIRFTAKVMVHGGVHRQVPRRQSFSTFRCRSVCPRRAVCNRDWPVRLPFADSGSEGSEVGGAKKGANGDSSRATSSHAQPRSMQLIAI